MPFRFPIAGFRFSLLLLFLLHPLLTAAVLAQEKVPPLPPPVTRGLYRSRWFEFLNAYLEDDARGAAAALSELRKAAQAVGVSRLSDFSRTAEFEGRLAETRGQFERAARAYDAALELDDSNSDAHFSRLAFLLRQGARAKATAALPAALSSLGATRENRLPILSAVAFWTAAALAGATAAMILILLVRHQRLTRHSLARARAVSSGAAVLPWPDPRHAPARLRPGALLAPSVLGSPGVFSGRRTAERPSWPSRLFPLGFVVPFLGAISYGTSSSVSPLYRRFRPRGAPRDASAEDGLRQASAVFYDDPDVWILLGICAERSSDRDRALVAYDKAVRTGPERYQGYLNRGNIHFQEGDFSEAVRDFEAAAQRAPGATEVFYNLALARAENYDFDGQGEALRRARALSAHDVALWSSHPTLAKVVSVPYPVARPRAKIEEWNRDPRGSRLPGHAPPVRLAEALLSPFAIGPWAARPRDPAVLRPPRRGAAAECVQCGRPHCKYCRRYGDPPGYCVSCARLRKEARGIDAQLHRVEEMKRAVRWRNVSCRVLSLVFPGAHRFFSRRPWSGFAQLFAFFFLIIAAAVSNRFFGPRHAAAGTGWTGLVVAALALAAILWLASCWSAWRRSHGA
jgi:tetratricopeptide (TPR) repeat protein